jgi:hypothetical protein
MSSRNIRRRQAGRASAGPAQAAALLSAVFIATGLLFKAWPF